MLWKRKPSEFAALRVLGASAPKSSVEFEKTLEIPVRPCYNVMVSKDCIHLKGVNMHENKEGGEKDEFFDLPPMPQQQEKRKNSTAKRVVCVLLALLLVGVGFLGGWFGYYYSLDEEMRTFLWAYGVSKRNYYREINEAELYGRLHGVLDLDPYSKLYSPDEYAEYMREGQGQNKGIGVSMTNETTKDGVYPRLFLVLENSPACIVGLRKGMYVLGFGTSADSLQTGATEMLAEFISQQEGSFVLRCGFESDGSDAENYTLERRAYQAAFVHYRDNETSFRFRGESTLALTETHEPLETLDSDTAYIRLDEFSGNAAAEFAACLNLMKNRKRTNLIIDLRTNGGGYLDILAEISSHLLRNAKERTPIVAKAVYRSGREQKTHAPGNYFSNYFSQDSRVYVLADENTASASECLIGALVDYGTIGYGDIFLREDAGGTAKTYGKGIMQSHFQSANGAAMKLTTAEIFWPSGKSIHGVGVIPQDGAVPIRADLIWGKSDPMLEEVCKRIN